MLLAKKNENNRKKILDKKIEKAAGHTMSI